MRFGLCFLTLLMLCCSAFAQDTVSIEKFCSELSQYKKPQGVSGPEYVPDVDVHGNKVASADLNVSLPVLDPVIIPLEFDLAQRYGLNLPLGAEAKPIVAQIAIYQDGRIFYNSEDISSRTYNVCAMVEKEKISHGQEDPHTISSSDTKKPLDKQGQDIIEGQYPESLEGRKVE